MNSRPLGRVRGGAPPPADTVIATKAEPSEDAIGFLYLTPFCPNLVIVHRITTIMVRNRHFVICIMDIMPCNHHFAPRNRVFDVLGEYYVG